MSECNRTGLSNHIVRPGALNRLRTLRWSLAILGALRKFPVARFARISGNYLINIRHSSMLHKMLIILYLTGNNKRLSQKTRHQSLFWVCYGGHGFGRMFQYIYWAEWALEFHVVMYIYYVIINLSRARAARYAHSFARSVPTRDIRRQVLIVLYFWPLISKIRL